MPLSVAVILIIGASSFFFWMGKIWSRFAVLQEKQLEVYGKILTEQMTYIQSLARVGEARCSEDPSIMQKWDSEVLTTSPLKLEELEAVFFLIAPLKTRDAYKQFRRAVDQQFDAIDRKEFDVVKMKAVCRNKLNPLYVQMKNDLLFPKASRAFHNISTNLRIQSNAQAEEDK